MSMFRAKRLDIGGFINVRVIRDHTKRKVFEQHETERYAPLALTCYNLLYPSPSVNAFVAVSALVVLCPTDITMVRLDKPFVT
jgi:small subunit ribosomal protein S14